MISLFARVEALQQFTKPREESKADILLAVKKGLVTPEDAYLMLQGIGFTPEAAEFILTVRAETTPFSPISFTEFKDLTTKYKIATGREVKPMSEEIKKAAEKVTKLTGELQALNLAIEAEERGLIDVPEVRVRLRTEIGEFVRLLASV